MAGPIAATLADAGATSVALADAFEHDPVMGWLVPQPGRRRDAYRRFFDLETRHHALRFPDSLLAREGDQVVGAALVLPVAIVDLG